MYYCDRAHNQTDDVPTQSDQFKTQTTGERLRPATAILSVRHLTTVAERPLFGSTMAGEDYPIGVPQTNRLRVTLSAVRPQECLLSRP